MSWHRILTADTLSDEHIAELAALQANPRKALQPQRRQLYKRLQLIRATEPPRPPRETRGRQRAPRPRAHVLTEAGLRVVAERVVAA